MAGILILLTLGVLVIPVILIVMVSGLKTQINILNQRVLQLYQELKNREQPVKAETDETTAPEATVAQQAYIPEAFVQEKPVDVTEPEIIPVVQDTFVPELSEMTDFNDVTMEEHVVTQPETEPTHEESVEQPIISPVIPTPVKQPGFNFERFIGENLINKIGIGVLVIGIGLFVKYAIDNDWINEIGRVVIGFLSGGILLALAYRFRNTYRAFSSVLTGGAMAVFYFTVAIAFREYALFGQTASFLMMVVITAFSVWLSILYNRRELAILSLIGGMLTPFMVSRGDGNYHVLFTYIAILNIGMLALSLRKQWKELLVISFSGTQLIFWLYYLQHIFDHTKNNTANVDAALLSYASIFYIIFLLMPLVQVFRGKDTSQGHVLHYVMLVTNSFLYLLAGMLLLDHMETNHGKGLLVALLAAVNAASATILYRNNQKDKMLFYLFLGLTIGFVTLIAPVQLNGNNITLFWATEAMILLWLFHKSNTVIYYYGSLLLLVGAFISLLIDHNAQPLSYGRILAEEGTMMFLNRYFITRLYTSLAFVAAGWMLRRYCRDHSMRTWALPDWLPTAIGTVAAGLLFYTGNNELNLYTDSDNVGYWSMAYLHVFTLALSVIVARRAGTCRFRFFAVVALWAVACVCYWVQTYDFRNDLEMFTKEHISYRLPILLYWIGFSGLCGIFLITARMFYKRYMLKSSQGKTFMWFFNITAVICLSVALHTALHHINTSLSSKAAITILWSLCAFVQMWLGMRLKYKTLRIISLSLLGLVLCKLFLFDLSNVSQGAKIVAFVVLGIILLVLSFLYQKLKKILFEEDEAV